MFQRTGSTNGVDGRCASHSQWVSRSCPTPVAWPRVCICCVTCSSLPGAEGSNRTVARRLDILADEATLVCVASFSISTIGSEIYRFSINLSSFCISLWRLCPCSEPGSAKPPDVNLPVVENSFFSDSCSRFSSTMRCVSPPVPQPLVPRPYSPLSISSVVISPLATLPPLSCLSLHPTSTRPPLLSPPSLGLSPYLPTISPLQTPGVFQRVPN